MVLLQGGRAGRQRGVRERPPRFASRRPAVEHRQGGGLKTKLLAGVSTRQHTYLAVPADSSIASLADLKGKKVALKGTNLQLAVAKILAGSGLSERDLRILNMDSATAKVALATRDIDAAFGGYDLLTLQDQGVAKIVYSTKNDSPACPRARPPDRHRGLREQVSRHHEEVSVGRRAGRPLIAQNEANPAPIYQLWSKSGVPY